MSELFEGALAHYGLNTTMIWADVDSELDRALSKLDLGLMSKMSRSNQDEVIVKITKYKDNHIKDLKQKPSYLCGFDVT